MQGRFVFEQERPSGWLADSYIAAALLLPFLVVLFGMMLWSRSPVSPLAVVIAVAGVVLALATYLADLQFRLTIDLGDDGIVAFGNRQDRIFVSHAAIRAVDVVEKNYVSIQRSDGRPLVWRASGHFPIRNREANARRTVAAIMEGRELFLSCKKAYAEEPLLHRSGRAPLDFVRDLKSLKREKVQTYRSAPFDCDRLWRVAENPSASPHDRVAAFVALRVEAGVADVMRLRESVHRVVNEKTAERLVRVLEATGDDDLVGALELDDDTPLSLPERLRRRRVS